MDNNNAALKKLALISLAAVGVLFVISTILYKERVLFADSAFIVFTIINTHEMAIQAGRYGSFITHIFPYIGQKMHLPIGTLIFLYGASFYLFFFTAVSLLVYWFKQYRIAILAALFFFLLVSQSYLWTNEIIQGTTWMFLLFGATLYMGYKKVNTVLLLIPFVLLAFLTLFTHFVIIIPTVFLWVYLIIEKKNWPFSKSVTILLSSVFAAIIVTKFRLALQNTESTYDAEHLQGMAHLSVSKILLSVKTPVIKMFVYRSIANYWAATIVFIIGFLSLLKNKQYLLATWTFLSCAGYLIIMGLTYGDLDKNVLLFHIESEWTCFAILAATPFVFSFLPGSNTRMVSCLLTAVFAVRLAYIVAFLPAFIARTHMKEQVYTQMRKKGITKLGIYSTDKLLADNIMDWGLPFESLLTTQAAGDKPQLIFQFVNKDNKKLVDDLATFKGMVISWDDMPGTRFDRRYFEIDTTRAYELMTYEEIMK